MNNYQFCVHWVLAQARSQGQTQAARSRVRVLDYGCGAGQIVQALRENGIDAYGCDVFFEGADYSALFDTPLYRQSMRRIEADGRIPFDDDSFDFIVSNQVMEHVQDIDRVLSEMRRVLKPGGKVLSLFPDKDVWREGHCGIPFLHWFPKGSRARVYYAAALRTLGLGYNKGDKPPLRWSEEFCDWLDQWTCYRAGSEIDRCYRNYFVKETDLEGYWLARRLERLGPAGHWIPEPARRIVARKLGGRAFVVGKPALPH